MSEVAPECDKYWKGALNWLISVAQSDERGHVYWYMSTSAPKGHPNRRIGIPGMSHVIRMFLAGYERCGDGRYRETALAATRTLVERCARRRRTRFGTGYAWSGSYRPNGRPPGLLAGHSHGLGNLIDTLLDAYGATRDDRLRAELRLAETMPDLELSDGTTPLSMADGSLRYVMSAAREARGGYVWPYMRHEAKSKNIGYGSGTGGIGWALLRGARANHKADPEFAAECMPYANGAATYAVNMVLGYQRTAPLPNPGGDAGFGVCGGVGGAGHFLMLCADAVAPRDGDLVGRIRAAIEKIANLVAGSAVEIDGALACPDWRHFKRINIALDYGQTGVVLGLAAAGKYLDNPELIDAAKKVADYMAQRAVREGDGHKFAQFHPLAR
ncbi:MAG TPA: hypothetical protein EYP56_02640 [Planctomycetaceae bacterium]|nr:hypothetical protein [Planctomycetaceae bacterium]